MKKRADFLRVASISKKDQTQWVSQSMIIQLAPSEELNIRYGVTVSKKVDKAAIRRNRIKRRLRAALDNVLLDYNHQAYDIVAIGRKLTLDCPFDKIENDLRWCLKRLNIRKNIS